VATSPLLCLNCKSGWAMPFARAALLQQAVTHRSFSADHNERLEFLGDSVLNLAVSHMLYTQLADMPEGDLSRVRANLVKQDTLHQLAKTWISAVMRWAKARCARAGKTVLHLGRHGRSHHWRGVPGWRLQGCPSLGRALVCQGDIKPDMQAVGKDPKTELQEWLQGRKFAAQIHRGRHLRRGAPPAVRGLLRSDRIAPNPTRLGRIASRGRTSSGSRHAAHLEIRKRRMSTDKKTPETERTPQEQTMRRPCKSRV
jgi:ribonuclease III